MQEEIIEVSGGFWNIRGSFRIGGVVDIKTQASLVRLANGNFVFLDSCSLGDAAMARIDSILGSKGEIEAILNLHPFHTVHVETMHRNYPDARLYGTVRHHERFPDMPWEAERTEDSALHQLYADDFDFSIPAGVDFVSSNDNVHFSSVLVMHKASRTIHVDDTFMYLKLPRLLRLFGVKDSLAFHPTLSMALERRAGAADDFRAWARSLIEQWGNAENLCAAHTAALLGRENRGASIARRMKKALQRCEPRLRLHTRRYG